MAKIQCKMCGGELTLPEGVLSGNCEYCGSLVTFPRVSSEHLENLYNRAEHFRRINDYDKAVNAYEKVVNANPDDPEAYWGLVLSRFGIEYVADPVTHERIPTCHRVQFESILADADYLAALERAGAAEKEIYEAEAHRIAEIQKGILAISSQEEPFDVFICYKESDENGKRTKDSALAQDIYYALTQENLKVFFARITLENKLGQQYEPYIFAALNSAKAMLVIGTKPEYFNAVWVRNEWSRYLALMKHDRKKLLIPCYKGMDAYDIPEELSMFQAQDMGKIGFIQDIIHGVKKVAAKTAPAAAAAASAPQPGTGKNNPLLRRAQIFVESGDFNSAREFCENVLNQEPENGWAYFTRMMAELQIADEKNLETIDFSDNRSYQLAQRFADEELKAKFAAIEAEKQQQLAAIKAEKERVERQRQAMLAAKRLDVALRNGINERINLLQRYLRCEKSLQKRQDVIAALEKSLAQEKGLLNRNELLTKDTVQPTREYSMQTMAAAGDLEEKESKLYRKIGIRIASLSSAVVAIIIVLMLIAGCVKKNNLASGDVCEFDNSIVVGVRYDKEDITKVVIPNGVTKIGKQAFYGCSSLTSVTIPDSVTKIDGSAFSRCSSLTSVTIPNSVTYIGKEAFSGCSSLTSVTIPDGVKTIESGAFEDCSSLTSVTIPASVTSIGKEAFSGCSSLKEVIVPEKCKIADNAFPPKCLVIKLPAELVIKIRQGDAYALAKLDELRSTLQQGIEFSDDFTVVTGVKNKSITTATIPASVTEIGEWAFYGCSSLTSVTIPDSVTEIGNYAFLGCSSLKEVIVPEKCKIANNAFPPKCLVIKLPAELVTKIRQGDAYALAKLDEWRLALQQGIEFSADRKKVTGVKNKNITTATIPASVTEIGGGAFSWCSSLKEVIVPEKCKIADNAFPPKCLVIRVDAETREIMRDAANGNAEAQFQLGEFYYKGKFGNAINYIEAAKWYRKSADQGNADARKTLEKLEAKRRAELEAKRRAELEAKRRAELKSLELARDVCKIENNVVCGVKYDRKEITKVVIPHGVTKIGSYAFDNCSSLTSVTIPDSVTFIGYEAFRNCSSLTSVTIPDSVTFIGYEAFYGCISLTSVTIPNRVTKIGGNAFSYCTSLTSVTIPNSVTFIGGGAFSGCTILTSVTIPNSVTEIGYGAFEGCSSLTSVTIPDSVTKIGNYAFNICSSLKEVRVPRNCSIGYEAFPEGCNVIRY